MIRENHIQFLETLCEGPVVSSEYTSKSYIFLKRKGFNINVTAICKNTTRNARKIKNEKFERRRFRIYWLDGFEMETITLFHQMLNFKNTQWQNVYLPILGKEYANRLKSSMVKKPYAIDRRFAKILPILLEEKKKESIRLIEKWIEEND